MSENDGISIPTSGEEHANWTPNSHEERAMRGGWKPEHEWDGDPEDWVDAKTFNVKGELMNRISQLGRQVGSLTEANQKLTKMVANSDQITRKMMEAEYNRAVRNLREQRKEALREGDHETADQIDEDLDELKDTRKQFVEAEESEKQQPKSDAPNVAEMDPYSRAWYDFVTTTKWAQDPELNAQLLPYAQGLLEAGSVDGVGDFMEQVLEKGKELRGGSRSRGPGGPDDAGTRRKTTSKASKGNSLTAKLSAQQKAIAQEQVEAGLLDNVEEYAKILDEAGML